MNQDQTTTTMGFGGDEQGEELAEMAQRALHAVEEFAQEQPHAALALAAAAGFVIGGGLTPRRLLRLGMAFTGPSLTRQIAFEVVRMAGEAADSEREPASRGGRSRRAKSRKEAV